MLSPTEIEMAPPAPLVDAPVTIDIVPEAPPLDVPVLMAMLPLVPVSPALLVAIEAEPPFPLTS